MTEMSKAFLDLLAHELRTPISVIIGYNDLLAEGILGTFDPPVADALDRIRTAADHLLALVASLGEGGVENPAELHVDIAAEDPREIFDAAIAALAPEADGRSTTLITDTRPDSIPFRTDRERVYRALILTLHAAIKSSAGATLHIEGHADQNAFTCTIRGALLDPLADAPAPDAITAATITAAGLRLSMAQQALAPIRGSIRFSSSPDTRLTVRIPGC
jgi:signal transduction histidine kinase